MYIIRCYNPESYTEIKNYVDENIKVSIFNSLHKGYVPYLDEMLKHYNITIEYPRGMEVEVAWIIGKVNKRYLDRVKVELMDSIYQLSYVNEIVIIGGGYSD